MGSLNTLIIYIVVIISIVHCPEFKCISRYKFEIFVHTKMFAVYTVHYCLAVFSWAKNNCLIRTSINILLMLYEIVYKMHKFENKNVKTI